MCRYAGIRRRRATPGCGFRIGNLYKTKQLFDPALVNMMFRMAFWRVLQVSVIF